MLPLKHESINNPHKKEKKVYRNVSLPNGIWIRLNDQFNTQIYVPEGRDPEKARSIVENRVKNPMLFA